MSSVIRTRFAPSPTGFLHVGGARTALFAWLYARHHNGQFILRVEDTDLERSDEASVQAILDGMKWLDLDFDEGPFYQTQRFPRYKEVISEWLSKGLAYRCVCSKERLEKLRTDQTAAKQKPRYDGCCRELNIQDTHQPFVVRFKNPTTGSVVFDDLIRGTISIENSELDDLIIARTDGSPTYNFCVVIDDSDMHITDVIRGDDHINNTPRQINMLQALGATIPRYAHVPMILGSDGKRLSKRHGAVSVLQFRDDGYLPEALLNYLIRLGWSHGDQEIFSRSDMIQFFDVAKVSKSPAMFNTEKLDWLNQHYFKTENPNNIKPAFEVQLQKLNINYSSGPDLNAVITLQADRVKTLTEMAECSRYFFETDLHYDLEAVKKHITPDVIPALILLKTKLADVTDWQKEGIHGAISTVAVELNLKMGKVAQPLRIAATGGTVSPSIDSVVQLLGKTVVLERINQLLLKVS